jgi:two-component system chemotaxis response regulator CheB
MGGVAIVQHPADALVRQMPDAALSHVPADYVIPAAEIADVLVNLAQGKWRPSIAPEEGLPL